jgi:hypothetical protein
MLAGFDEFKSSLFHEYVGVLDAFVERVGPGSPLPGAGRDGVEATRLISRAYALASIRPLSHGYYERARQTVHGR